MIILDAGHGILQKGKTSFDGSFREYIFNRNVVSKLAVMLKAARIPFAVTTPDFNYDKLVFNYNYPIGQALRLRVNNAERFKEHLFKSSNCIFISIHADVFGKTWSSPKGVHVIHHKTSRKGRMLAELFSKEIAAASGLGLLGDGITSRDDLTVLKDTSMPAILTENGFYSNREQLELLKTAEMQERIALGHFNAIKKLPIW